MSARTTSSSAGVMAPVVVGQGIAGNRDNPKLGDRLFVYRKNSSRPFNVVAAPRSSLTPVRQVNGGLKGALATCVSRVGADGDLSIIVLSRLGGDDELADDKPAQDRAVTGLGRAPLVLLVLGQDCPSLDSTPISSYRREEVHVHLVDEVRPDDAKVVGVAACIAADAERGDELAAFHGGLVTLFRGDRLRPTLGTLLLEHEEWRGRFLRHVEGFEDAAVVQHGRRLNPAEPVPRGSIEVALALIRAHHSLVAVREHGVRAQWRRAVRQA
eukprot:scaffold24101_cov63-Phaeocystis_antarctica.AAC.1